MLHGVYILWALLPLALIILSVRAGVRVCLKKSPREYALDYLLQSVFCALAFGFAVVIDRVAFEPVEAVLGSTNAGFIRWLIYPAILVLLAIAFSEYSRRAEESRQKERSAALRRKCVRP